MIAYNFTRWRGISLKCSHRMEDGHNYLKISAPRHLMKTYRMTPLSARSMSMGNIFKNRTGSFPVRRGIKVYIYIEYQSCCPFVGIGSPTPSPASVSPPLESMGGPNSLSGKVWGNPISTKGQTLWYSMYTIIPLRYCLSIFLKNVLLNYCSFCTHTVILTPLTKNLQYLPPVNNRIENRRATNRVAKKDYTML
jgi:hypothetical protein